MSNRYLDDLSAELHLRDVREEADGLTRSVDWEKRQIVERAFAKERKQQMAIFERDRRSRLRMAAAAICDRRSIDHARLLKRKDPKSKALAKKVERAAWSAVEADHDRRMTQIDRREAKALNELVATARDRENGPQPSAPPKQLTDQRSALDRLSITRSR
ncbi:MAG: hypothetical protein AAF360_01555 [Pseudomonadota bacterium]